MCKGFLLFFFREGEFIILCLYHLMVNGQFGFLCLLFIWFYNNCRNSCEVIDLLRFVVNKGTDTCM